MKAKKPEPQPADERAGQEALQRLADLTRRVVRVPKAEVAEQDGTPHES